VQDAILIDIGLEHCRVSLVQRGRDGKPCYAHNSEFAVADFADLPAMLERYRLATGLVTLPAVAGIAFGGPVRGQQGIYSNTVWTFSEAELAERFGFAQIVPVNDVAALAASLPWLGPKDLSPVGGGVATSHVGAGRYAVIFAGQGLGVAALTHSHDVYDLIDTEAGHATFAPASAYDVKVLERLARMFGRVSFERVLSTPGLVNIYRAICEIEGLPVAPMTPLEILLYARTNADPACRRALDFFYAALGTFAGDVALNLCAEGGIYLVGDVIAETDDALQHSDFRKRFCDKGRFAEFVGGIPTFAINNRSARLIGLSRLVSEAITAREAGSLTATGMSEVFSETMEILNQTVVVAAPDLTVVSIAGQDWGAAAEDVLSVGTNLADALHTIEARGLLGLDPDFGGVDLLLARMRRGESFCVDRHLFGGRVAELGVSPRGGGGYVIVSRDVTELRKRTKDLEDLARNLRAASSRAEGASRAKSQFLANMSHEIRTPLNGVLGMAEILSRTPLASDQQQMIDTVIASGTHLLAVINDILDFSKIEAGKMRLSRAPFDLRTAIEDALALLAPQAEAKGLELALRVAPKLHAAVAGDEGRIRQILNNVVGNAIKFTETGHVLVEVDNTLHDGRLRVAVAVSDTGCGIPKDKLGQVFEMFEQVDGSASRRHDGSGLGLAITCRLLELMDGTISVESEMNAGTTFRMTFLVDPSQEVAAAPVSETFDLSGREILIVDDKAVNRWILEEQARGWGMTPTSVCDAGAALDLVAAERSGRFALAILDYHMPGMNGLDLAKAMKADPAWSALPLLLLTSVVHLSDLSDDESELFAAVLVKPARTVQLEAQVRAILSKGAVPVMQPRAPAPVAAAPCLPAGPRDVRSSKITVLVAEDNSINRKVIEAMLANDGYDLVFAPDGEAAVAQFKQAPPDVVLMDVSMPKLDGYGATAAIRKLEQGQARHVPIVGLTAHAMPEARQACLDAGMDEYLAKPLHQDTLRALVARVVRRTA
jgi:glucokinase